MNSPQTGDCDDLLGPAPRKVHPIPVEFPDLPADLVFMLQSDGFYFLMLEVPTLLLVVPGEAPLNHPCIMKYAPYEKEIKAAGVEFSIAPPGFPGTEE